jgi:subtilase family serine protease
MPTMLVAGRTAAVVALALSGVALTIGNTAAATSPLQRIGQAPRTGSGAVRLGALSGGARLEVDVELRPRSTAALARYATAVSTPGDRLFRHYLARGQFAGRFGPPQSALSAVTRWLTSRGLAVTTISSNHLTVQVASSVSTLDRSLSLGLERFRLQDGRIAFANTRAPRFGGGVGRFVQGVVGLDDLRAPSWLGVRPVTPVTRARSHALRAGSGLPPACPAAVGEAAGLHTFTTNQLAGSYNLSGLYTAGDEGAGITIAVFEQETNLSSDITAYQDCYGLRSDVSYLKVDGGSPSTFDGEAEEDIELAMGFAPKATIDVFQAPDSLRGTLDDYTAIVDRDTAQVVSTSWGQCEAQAGAALSSAENLVFEQAAVQGQSVVAASGDDGSSDCAAKALAVDDPGSQPYVTGVGGTLLNALGPPPVEVTWNVSASSSGASGGGLSAFHSMPSYQSTAPSALHVVSTYSSGTPCGASTGGYCREVPDVSADAGYTNGYLTYFQGRWENNGGTSAGAPLWAALFALADASKGCDGKSVGFANPAVYEAAATSYSSDFHDVTSGTNDDTNWGNTSGLYPAGVGYDMATGLGTPNGANLAKTLCEDTNVSIEPTTTVLSLRSGSVALGSERTETFTVRTTGDHGDGRPVGSIVVFNVNKKLCSHLVVPATSDQSVGQCSLTSSELRAGRHPDVYAVFDPDVGSSSDSHVRYRSSRSTARSLTVT